MCAGLTGLLHITCLTETLFPHSHDLLPNPAVALLCSPWMSTRRSRSAASRSWRGSRPRRPSTRQRCRRRRPPRARRRRWVRGGMPAALCCRFAALLTAAPKEGCIAQQPQESASHPCTLHIAVPPPRPCRATSGATTRMSCRTRMTPLRVRKWRLHKVHIWWWHRGNSGGSKSPAGMEGSTAAHSRSSSKPPNMA